MAIHVLSPTTGIVMEIKVAKGASVGIDDELMIIESMKMHIPVTAPQAGLVQDIHVSEGQQINETDPVVTLA